MAVGARQNRPMRVILQSDSGDLMLLEGEACGIQSKSLATRFGLEFDEVIRCQAFKMQTLKGKETASGRVVRVPYPIRTSAMVMTAVGAFLLAILIYWLLELVNVAPYIYFEYQPDLWIPGWTHQLLGVFVIFGIVLCLCYLVMFRLAHGRRITIAPEARVTPVDP